ncbi:C-type lectin domain family 10 member A [Pangasianodon hypophthalmus]|uniref:C-type lectin domain family 10 member A n=1 Tax=Pangasianodon hypophthalmus TaxID=310915 RepID=UPI002307C946|nr:C-type lectin domain family 10 member A [Pangasianodon hypophthalmus]
MEVIENASDSESIYMNVEEAQKTSDQNELYSNICLNTTTEIPGSAGARERRKVNFSNTAAVVLGFLCVLLLAVITVLCIKHNKEMHQIQSSNDNITVERDQLQSRYNIMRVERDQLQSRYNIMRVERDQLQSRYNIINMEKNGLLNLNNKLTSEKSQLQSSYNALNSERDTLQKTLTEIASCPYGWTRFLSSCYRVSSSLKPWVESRQDCRTTGADLVIINSREEQQFVSGLRRNLWIGLTDIEQEGQWKWVDNTSLESGYWMNNEPNNVQYRFGDEDCAQVVSLSPAISSWNDFPCSSGLYGLCEKKIRCSTQ